MSRGFHRELGLCRSSPWGERICSVCLVRQQMSQCEGHARDDQARLRDQRSRPDGVQGPPGRLGAGAASSPFSLPAQKTKKFPQTDFPPAEAEKREVHRAASVGWPSGGRTRSSWPCRVLRCARGPQPLSCVPGPEQGRLGHCWWLRWGSSVSPRSTGLWVPCLGGWSQGLSLALLCLTITCPPPRVSCTPRHRFVVLGFCGRWAPLGGFLVPGMLGWNRGQQRCGHLEPHRGRGISRVQPFVWLLWEVSAQNVAQSQKRNLTNIIAKASFQSGEGDSARRLLPGRLRLPLGLRWVGHFACGAECVGLPL